MGYNRPNTYSLYIGFGSFNPVDATTYYFSNITSVVPGTGSGVLLIYIPRQGVIRACSLQTFSGTATGTNEDWTIAIRKNNTTDYTIATVGAATPSRHFANYALDIPVKQGDYIEMTTTTPTWATNPEGCRGYGNLLLECA
jgi:hypothetical protein